MTASDTRTFIAPGVDALGLDDDVLDPLPGAKESGTGPGTVLDELREALAKEVDNEPVTLLVASREGIAVTYATRIPAESIKQWRKRCKDRTSESGVDEVRFSATVLANMAMHVSINDKVVEGADQEPLSFRHREFHAMLGVSSALAAVTRLYGNDAMILASADEVLKTAGYGEEAVRAEDPTNPR